MVVMVTDLSEKIDLTGRLYLGLEQIENCMEFSALIPQVRTNFGRPALYDWCFEALKC